MCYVLQISHLHSSKEQQKIRLRHMVQVAQQFQGVLPRQVPFGMFPTGHDCLGVIHNGPPRRGAHGRCHGIWSHKWWAQGSGWSPVFPWFRWVVFAFFPHVQTQLSNFQCCQEKLEVEFWSLFSPEDLEKLGHVPSHIKTLMNLETCESLGPPVQAHWKLR